MWYSAIARRAFRELVSKELIERVGEYDASNPIFRGLKLKEKGADDGGKKKGGSKKEKKEEKEAAKEKKAEEKEEAADKAADKAAAAEK